MKPKKATIDSIASLSEELVNEFIDVITKKEIYTHEETAATLHALNKVTAGAIVTYKQLAKNKAAYEKIKYVFMKELEEQIQRAEANFEIYCKKYGIRNIDLKK